MGLHRSLLARSLVCALVASAFALSARAQDEAPKPETVVVKLYNPSGVVVHKPTSHVFVTSERGVFRFVPGKPGKVYIEVDGYPTPTDIYGKGPKFEIGPLGAAFWGDDRLVVGGGSRVDGEELAHVYKIGPEPPARALKEDAAEFTLGPIEKSDQTTTGEGNFYGVAVVGESIFLTTNGDDTKGWIARSKIADGKPGPLELAIATKPELNVDAPVPATVSPEGELVIGQMGEVNIPGDSLLTYWDADSGELKRSIETGLSDLAGLAYSPKTGHLYGTDFSWVDPTKGALYRLDVDGDEVTAVKILDLNRPTGLDFDSEGNLYIAVFGQTDGVTEEGKSPEATGSLLRIAPGL